MTMTKAFSLLIGFSTLFQIANAATECVLSNPITIKDGLTLQQVQNSADGTYSMRLTYTGGQSWIGIGINEEGKSKMSPANAVIGRVEDDGSTSVLHYRMTSDDKDASGVQPYDSNTLKNASFEQTEGTSILTFTQDLSEMGVSNESVWIFAVGLADNEWVGKHKIHGSFQFTLSENCVTVPDPTPAPTNMPVTPDPTPNPTRAPVTPNPTQRPVTAAPTPNPTKTPTTSSPTTAPLTTNSSTTKPTKAPVVANSPSPTKSRPATISPTVKSSTASPSASPVTSPTEKPSTESPTIRSNTSSPTKPWIFSTPVPTKAESDDNENNVFATNKPTEGGIVITATESPVSDSSSTALNSDNNEAFGGFVFLDTTHPNKTLWMAHGIVLAVAWGVCAPIGIGASLLKHVLKAKFTNGPSWYSLHYYLNVLTMYLTGIGFLIGVLATWKEGETHFRESLHHQLGLAIMIIVVVQALAGFFRPGLPQPRPSEVVSSEESTQVDGHEAKTVKGSNLKPAETSTDDEEVGSDNTPLDSPSKSQATAMEKVDSSAPEKKSTARIIWEWTHRILGIALVGLAWYNCHTGIEWQLLNWEDSVDWTILFWTPTAVISGTIIFLKLTMAK